MRASWPVTLALSADSPIALAEITGKVVYRATFTR